MLGEKPVTYKFPLMQPERQLRELILHIAERSQGDPKFGKVKLAKILYFADFASYRRYGEPITGSAYVKEEFGPIPEAYLDIIDEMYSVDEIDIQLEQYYEYEKQRIVSRREPDLTIFSGRDIAIIDKVIQDFWRESARDLSEMSHGIAWRLVEFHEPIPYEASLLSDESISQEDIEHVAELMEKYGDEL